MDIKKRKAIENSRVSTILSNQKTKHINVAIQGLKGSFHHLVANDFFGNNINTIECMSFAEIPELLKNGTAKFAIMAIENTNTGAFLSNYLLIDKYDLNIQDEVYLPIQYNLMALKGQNLTDIEEVWSDPVAIKNCEPFLKKHPHIKIIEESDTAFVAKQIKDLKIKGVAAIASTAAANIYDLQILEKITQTNSCNITRFLILTKKRDFSIDVNLHNKGSLKFILDHKLGSLAEILNICAKYNLNLSRIQSIPIANEPWNYAIFIDHDFDDYLNYCNALLKIEKKVTTLKILGEYAKGKQVTEMATI